MREAEKAKQLWFGDRLGGFEAPVPGKSPERVHVPELKVTCFCFLIWVRLVNMFMIRSWLS